MLRDFKVLVFLGILFLAVGSYKGNAQVVIDISSDYFKNVYEGRNNVLKGEIELLNGLDNLSKIIEQKGSLTKQDIDKFSDDVISLTELSAKNVRDSIPVSKGLDTVVSDSDIDAKRPFKGFYVKSLTDIMLDMLKDSKIYKVTRNEIKEFNRKNAEFDKRLEKIVIAYTKLWIKDIRTGNEYDKVLADYKGLINDIVTFNIKFYESKVNPADSKMIATLQKIKRNKIDSEIKDRLKTIERNLGKLNKFQ